MKRKSRLLIVANEKGNTATVCWLGYDKFAEEIKSYDSENPYDLDLITLDSVIIKYFEPDELTKEDDLIGLNWDEENTIKSINYSREL